MCDSACAGEVEIEETSLEILEEEELSMLIDSCDKFLSEEEDITPTASLAACSELDELRPASPVPNEFSPPSSPPESAGPPPILSLVKLLQRRLHRACVAEGSLPPPARPVPRSQPAPNVLLRTAREIRRRTGTAVDINLKPKREKTKHKANSSRKSIRARARSSRHY